MIPGLLLFAAALSAFAATALQDRDFESRAAVAIAALERDPDAVEPVLALLREAPRYLPLHRALVATAERQGDWLRALRGWRQIEELAGPSAVDQLAIARTALAAGAYDLARCHASAAVGARPDSDAAWLLLSRADAAEDRHETALASADRALALGERTAEELLLRGELLYRLMRIPEAVAAFAQALAEDADAAETVASFALSGALSSASRSSASGSSSPSGSPGSAPDSQDLADLRRRLEEQALAHPERVNTRYALGVLAMREGRAGDARRWLEPLAGTLDEPPVHYNLSLAYRALGMEDAARRALTRFAELEEQERSRWEEQNRVDRLRGQAAAARAAGDTRSAVSLWEQADVGGALAPEDLLAWGGTLLEMGDAAAARRVLERALFARPADLAAIDATKRAAAAGGDERSVQALAARAALLDPASWACGSR